MPIKTDIPKPCQNLDKKLRLKVNGAKATIINHKLYFAITVLCRKFYQT